jgi:hypothetical protein
VKKRAPKVTDPLQRDCTACGALVGKPCLNVGKNGNPIPLVPRASRLVHADRIEPPTRKGSHA